MKRHTQEESLKQLSTTDVGPRTARWMAWSFVAMIATIPAVQTAHEVYSARVQLLDLTRPLVNASSDLVRGKLSPAWSSARVMFEPTHLHGFEQGLEHNSIFKAAVQPRVQNFLTGRLGFGNEKVVVGRAGWLYYQPGLGFLTGPSVTNAGYLGARAKKMLDSQLVSDPHPDPRQAILQFKEECEGRGIHLVDVPVPDKTMAHPENLTARLEHTSSSTIVTNRGYPEFIQEMRRKGVDVLDLVAPETKDQLFLKQDTHWTPLFMENSARQIARHIKQLGSGDIRVPTEPMRLRRAGIANTGDLVSLLSLPDGQTIYRPETTEIEKVLRNDDSGAEIQPSPSSSVLLLGDSFTEIYSQEQLGWGTGAGLAEHISYQLGGPIDVLARNGSGASGTRIELSKPDNQWHLNGKRIIIWEFAMRDLAVENWALVAEFGTGSAPIEEASAQLVIVGRVVKTSVMPEPNSAPYADCLITILFEVERVESGHYSGREALAILWGMKNNRWLPAARFIPGERHRLTLISFKNVDPAVHSIQRVDDIDDYEHLPLFATEEHSVQ